MKTSFTNYDGKQMTKEGKRGQILDALEQLLPGRRFHEITLDEVARAAQVGKGTIYLYFKDKDALFAEMVCYRLEKLQQQMEQLANCCDALAGISNDCSILSASSFIFFQF